MDLLDRILGLKSEQQQFVDTLVAIIEEDEELKKDKERLERQVEELECEVIDLRMQLEAEKQKIRDIETLIEDSIAAIKDMR